MSVDISGPRTVSEGAEVSQGTMGALAACGAERRTAIATHRIPAGANPVLARRLHGNFQRLIMENPSDYTGKVGTNSSPRAMNGRANGTWAHAHASTVGKHALRPRRLPHASL